MSDDKSKPDRSTDDEELFDITLGGHTFKKGDTLSPEEFEEFTTLLIKKSGGRVIIEDVDVSTGTLIRSAVDDWSEFEQGPRLSEDYYTSFKDNLVRKGYLAFEKEYDSLLYHTAFRVLKPSYFDDFDYFTRCQEIPDHYFGPVMAGESWFISHRWATPDHPDPSQIQFAIVRDFVRRHQVTGIWYDYSCMPQRPHTPSEEKLFAESIKHMNSLIVTTNFMSIESDDYLDRAWCFFERVIAELLCTSKHVRLAPRAAPRLSSEVVNDLIVNGKKPALRVTHSQDRPIIEDLLVTGSDFFKMLAITTTFTLLNSFGFQFGVKTAARFSQVIDFGKFWTVWQTLAGSSEGSGIRVPDLLNADRLRTVLTRRHERFGTHARFFAGLQSRMTQLLDMRIVEEGSSSRLATLVSEVSRTGLVPEAYTKLALIELVYWLAGRDQSSEGKTVIPKNTKKQQNPPAPRALSSAEVFVIFALDNTGPQVDDVWFDEIFQSLASEFESQGVWFGSWKILRVADMRIEMSNAPGTALRLPSPVLDELRLWDSKQSKPNSMRIVKISEFAEINCFAFVIHVSND